MTTFNFDLAGLFYRYHFGRQLVHWGFSALNIPSPIIGIAYSIYDTSTDKATLYDFVTNREVGFIDDYHRKFSQHRARSTQYIRPNVFVRRYYGQPNNYLLNESWMGGYLYPSCAEFLTTLSVSTVLLSYLVHNGYLPPSEEIVTSDFYMSYNIPEKGYPRCKTCIKTGDAPDNKFWFFCTEAEVTSFATWYSPRILSDIFVYLAQGSWLWAARIGGLYSVTGRLFRNLCGCYSPTWACAPRNGQLSVGVCTSVPSRYKSFMGVGESPDGVSKSYDTGYVEVLLIVNYPYIWVNIPQYYNHAAIFVASY